MSKIAVYTVGQYFEDGLRIELTTHDKIKANEMCNWITNIGRAHYIRCEMMDLRKYLWLNRENLTSMEILELTDE